MLRTILIYGAISGSIAAGFLVSVAVLGDSGVLKFDTYSYGMYVGYATMLVALSMVYFGTRSYRDNVLGGSIGFWKAAAVGILITLLASLIYAAVWEIYVQFRPDFMDKYIAGYLEKLRTDGTAIEKIEELAAQFGQMREMYKNPLIRFAITLTEILPVGILVTLISSATLRKGSIEK